LRLIGIEGVAGGQEPKVLYSNPELYYIVPVGFFPDGKRILALFQRKDRSVQMVIFAIEDQSVNVLKTVDWRGPGKTALSPDGRYIAYDFPVGEGEAPRDIFLLAADGSQEIPLVSHPANDEVLGWAPDGSAVLFASDRGGRRGAWLLPVTGGKAQDAPRVVKSELDVAMAIGFSRDGSFFYGFRTGMQDIYTAALDFEAGKLLGAPEKLTQRFVGSNRSPAWSADGKYLAYLSRRKDRVPGPYTIVIRSIETGQERDIHPQTGYIAQVKWAPDGRSLYFASPDERSRWTVFRLNVETEELTTLVAPEGDAAYYFSVVVSPDGGTLYYGADSFSEKDAVIRARDLKTGDEREIYKVPERWFRFDLSPDGRLLALVQEGHTPDVSLNVLPVEGGTLQELVRLQKPESMGSKPIWTVDSRHILFWKRLDVRSDSPEGELWSVPIDGGPLRRISAEHQQYVPQALHPDGRQIALAAGRDRREIWAIENLLPDREAAK
jgi:Tol biopolymer transport system component